MEKSLNAMRMSRTMFPRRYGRFLLIWLGPHVTSGSEIDTQSKNMWRTAGNVGSLGIEIAAALAIGYLGGAFLDQKLNTQPWFAGIGFFAGVGAAIKALVRVVRQYNGKKRNEDVTNPPTTEKSAEPDRNPQDANDKDG